MEKMEGSSENVSQCEDSPTQIQQDEVKSKICESLNYK